MRRDSPQISEYGVCPAIWYEKYFWPNWKIPLCDKDKGSLCLGAFIHVINEYATSMLNPELREIAIQYDEDHELIFSSNNEFIRYHLGEDFGSLAWYKRTLAYKFSTSQKVAEEKNSGQLKLF